MNPEFPTRPTNRLLDAIGGTILLLAVLAITSRAAYLDISSMRGSKDYWVTAGAFLYLWSGIFSLCYFRPEANYFIRAVGKLRPVGSEAMVSLFRVSMVLLSLTFGTLAFIQAIK